MNDEKTSTEAEQKKPGDLNAGIERMIADLETIGSIIRTTRLLAEGMENGGLKWVTLSKALGNIRHVLGPCAIMPEACFHKVYDFASGTGAFRTPKEIIDFVTANPPIHILPAAEPLDLSTPKIRRGEGHALADVKTDTCGIRRGNGTVRAWAILENAGVQVFAKQLFADGKYADCWNVTGTIDCEKAIIATVFGGRNRMNKIAKFIRNGLLAARMRNRHHRLNAKAREDANAGEKEGC